MRDMFYNLIGKKVVPVSLQNWKFEPDRHITETTVGKYWVSTVFLGLDRGWDGPPVVFETMVFTPSKSKDKWDNYQERYRTYDAALIGHERIVMEIRRSLKK